MVELFERFVLLQIVDVDPTLWHPENGDISFTIDKSVFAFFGAGSRDEIRSLSCFLIFGV